MHWRPCGPRDSVGVEGELVAGYAASRKQCARFLRRFLQYSHEGPRRIWHLDLASFRAYDWT